MVKFLLKKLKIINYKLAPFHKVNSSPWSFLGATMFCIFFILVFYVCCFQKINFLIYCGFTPKQIIQLLIELHFWFMILFYNFSIIFALLLFLVCMRASRKKNQNSVQATKAKKIIQVKKPVTISYGLAETYTAIVILTIIGVLGYVGSGENGDLAKAEFTPAVEHQSNILLNDIPVNNVYNFSAGMFDEIKANSLGYNSPISKLLVSVKNNLSSSGMVENSASTRASSSANFNSLSNHLFEHSQDVKRWAMYDLLDQRHAQSVVSNVAQPAVPAQSQNPALQAWSETSSLSRGGHLTRPGVIYPTQSTAVSVAGAPAIESQTQVRMEAVAHRIPVAVNVAVPVLAPVAPVVSMGAAPVGIPIGIGTPAGIPMGAIVPSCHTPVPIGQCITEASQVVAPAAITVAVEADGPVSVSGNVPSNLTVDNLNIEISQLKNKLAEIENVQKNIPNNQRIADLQAEVQRISGHLSTLVNAQAVTQKH